MLKSDFYKNENRTVVTEYLEPEIITKGPEIPDEEEEVIDISQIERVVDDQDISFSDEEINNLFGPHNFPVDNESKGIHGILIEQMKRYGIGEFCLLVAEQNTVKQSFKNQFPDTLFRTCGLYGGDHDYEWDFNRAAETASGNIIVTKFNSILCQATFEHILNPFGTLQELSKLLYKDGHIFLHMAGMKFKQHKFPEDYFRVFNSWFIDACGYMSLECKSLFVVDVPNMGDYIFVVYKRTG